MKVEGDCMHDWRVFFHGREAFFEVCQTCGAKRKRSPSEGEWEAYQQKFAKESVSPTDETLDLFFREVWPAVGANSPNGHELIKACESFAGKHPEVQIAWCDDSWNANSRLVILPDSCASGEPRGVFVFYVPQLSGQPAQFYLNKGQIEVLCRVLGEMIGGHKPPISP